MSKVQNKYDIYKSLNEALSKRKLRLKMTLMSKTFFYKSHTIDT